MDATAELESYLEDLDRNLENGKWDMEMYEENDEVGVDGVNDDDGDDGEGDDNNEDNLEHNGDVENVEEFLPEDAINDDDIDDDELEDGTIFMDAEGNYYYQSGKKAVPVKPIRPVKKRRAPKTLQEPASIAKKRKIAPSQSQAKAKEKLTILLEPIPSHTKSPVKPGPASSKKSPPIKTSLNYTNKNVKKPATSKSSSLAIVTNSIKIEQVVKEENWNYKCSAIVDETISSQATTRVDEEVYEFEETGKNIDDPDDPDYTVDTNADEGSEDHVIEYEAKIKPNNAKTDVGTGKFQCTLCVYSTDKKFLLSRHIKTHSDDRPYKCSVCERGFKTNISLVNHINTHLGNKPHQCADCEKSFTTSGELTRHRRYRHTGIKPHKCTECDYSSVELSKLRRHMRCHTGERPYQCPHCTYASPDTFKLKRHLRTHTGEKPYECDICHARFTQSNSLKYHRLIHSVNDKPVFQCNLCPTTCGRKTDLRLHIQKQHNTDHPVTCKRCGKELPDRYSYKMHVKTHEGEKCYRCTLCPYASISQRHLDTHMLLHTDSKPFQCDLCEQNFRQKQLLMRHVKIYHTQNYQPPAPRKKAHRCPHCERSFAFNGNLIRHMETHDPNSQHYEEKLKLRIGRMKRVQPDGTVVTKMKTPFLYPDDEVEDGDEFEEGELEEMEEIGKGEILDEDDNDETIQYMYEEYVGDEDEEEPITAEKSEILLKHEKLQTPTIMNVIQKSTDTGTASYKVIKQEQTTKNLMQMECDEDQGFMVIEVLGMEEEDETPTQVAIQKPKAKVQKKSKKTTVKGLEDITSDCFGFDDDADADEVEDNAAQELIQILSED